MAESLHRQARHRARGKRLLDLFTSCQLVMRSRLLRDGDAWALLSFVAEFCEHFVWDLGEYVGGCCTIAQDPSGRHRDVYTAVRIMVPKAPHLLVYSKQLRN
jgi:hypothetical protein